jgi:eukaryotic-like serine/threonine-protein kinase
MTSERWKQIERLYCGALDRAPSERAQYLAEATAGDEALRAEVESLLRYHQQAADFIEPASREQPVSPIAGLIERVRGAAAPGRFAGHVFGSYEVKSLIAAGGMGEVYRAIDTRLDRVVAIKILPAHLSDDPDRRERFKREAKIVSSLNHPHICALYDVGVQDGTEYLVMEHIDGETLQDRIQRGPVPLAQAVDYLIQIADALDKAHRRGIVHRDLKPGNIMLTKSGVKLLDFGLAAQRAGGSQAGQLSKTDSEQTLTVHGVIMGTIQYMAPEQLQGQPSDARTDIFAFGAVAYEMLTGRRAFEGETQAALIGAILRDEPKAITELVPESSPPLARALTRCLAKDPDERWQTANDLLFELRSLSPSSGVMNVRERNGPHVPRWLERGMWLVAIAAVGVAGVYWVQGREVPAAGSIKNIARVEFPLIAAEGTLLSGPDVPFAVSPDGRYIAYVTVGKDETSRLAVQSLASAQHKLLPGTDGASTPFWSPDSKWIAFFAANSLKKVRVSTGLAQTIAHDVSTTFSGASWSVHDDIVFPNFVGSLTRVRATGGPLRQLKIERVFSAQFLPDGRHILYAAAYPPSIRVTTLDAEPPRTLMTFPVRISPVAYASGYILFIRDGTLYARPFDEQRVAFSGDEIRVVEAIPLTTPARAPFSVSNAGVLAYWTHPLGTSAMLRWFDRTGHRLTAAIDAPQQYRGFDISADGSRLVFSRIDNSGSALWMRDAAGANETRLTFDEAYTPQLSPEGNRLLFSGPGPAPPPKLFLMSKLATAESALVATTSVPNFASGWSGDGRLAITVRIDPSNRLDVWHHVLPKGPEQRLPFNTSSIESQAKVSPDNRWIAFVTDRSGRDEVWVASFPSGDTLRPLSREGGSLPQWTARGKEIVYLSEDKRLIAVPFSNGVIGNPEPLFAVDKIIYNDRIVMPTANAYVPTADGQRFLVAEPTPNPNVPPIKIIVNWWASVAR